MARMLSPLALSIACVPLGIVLAVIGIGVELDVLCIAGNVVSFGGLLGIAIGVHRWKQRCSSTPGTSAVPRIGTYAILVIANVSLPCTVFLALAQPKGSHVPPSLIVLPLGMLGVGLHRAFPGQTWRRILRFGALGLFALAVVSTLAIWYIESRSNPIGFRIGEGPGEYAPQNIIALLFLPLLFLYASPSEKVQRQCWGVVWLGFLFALLFLCMFTVQGLWSMAAAVRAA